MAKADRYLLRGKNTFEKIDTTLITEELVSNYMYTKNIPDPDLMIRTSGELRISNFLLWQISYAELYFPKCYFPDFNKEELINAILYYNGKERRFGGVLS